MTPTGGRPPHARIAPMMAMTFDFESAAPRPMTASSVTTGSNGAVVHRLSSPAPTTS